MSYDYVIYHLCLVSTVVLPPEKAEGCESYMQYLHAEDGDAAREVSKSNGKKRISLNVKPQCVGSLFCSLFNYSVITQTCLRFVLI